MTVTDEDARIAAFVALTEGLSAKGDLSPLGAGLLAALHLGIANDSRSFARLFGIEHALVLREAVALSEDPGLVVVERQDARTQRLWLSIGESARYLITERLPPT